MRRLVADIDSPDLLDELVTQTRFNCSLLQTASKISRRRLEVVAHNMPDFPVLQSASTELREPTRLFLREIKLRANLPGPRGSTRVTASAFGAIAKDIVTHLRALLTLLPALLAHPGPQFALDRTTLEPAALNALTFFERLQFDVRVPKLTLKNWPQLWNIIATLVVTQKPTCGYNDWSLCSWCDLYDNPELRMALAARSHTGSEAKIHSHIRDKIKQKIEAELGITKLRKRANKRH